LSFAIAEKELFRSLMEIETELALPLLLALGEDEVAGAELDTAGAELLLELAELLQAAAVSSAAAAAAAVSPARADTEYNGVPRSFSRHARIGMYETRSV
jgi:hypothetical protein